MSAIKDIAAFSELVVRRACRIILADDATTIDIAINVEANVTVGAVINELLKPSNARSSESAILALVRRHSESFSYSVQPFKLISLPSFGR
jgi:hypothetical protein